MKKLISTVFLVAVAVTLNAATITGKIAKTSGVTNITIYTLDGDTTYSYSTSKGYFRIDLDDDKYYTIVFEDQKLQRKVVYVDTHGAWTVLTAKIYINRPDTYLQWRNDVPFYDYITSKHWWSLHKKFLLK